MNQNRTAVQKLYKGLSCRYSSDMQYNIAYLYDVDGKTNSAEKAYRKFLKKLPKTLDRRLQIMKENAEFRIQYFKGERFMSRDTVSLDKPVSK